MDKYLQPTYFIDSDSDLVKITASRLVSGLGEISQKAINLYNVKNLHSRNSRLLPK